MTIDLSPGLKVGVLIPDTLPYPYATFTRDWQEWVKTLKGRNVKLDQSESMGNSAGPDIPGWRISETAPDCVSNWIPTEWLSNKTARPAKCGWKHCKEKHDA